MATRSAFAIKVLLMVMALWCGDQLMKLYVGGPNPAQRLGNAIADDDVQAMDDAIADGAPLDDVNTAGQTLLMQAAALGKERVARAMLDRGADPNAVNRSGQTALFYAAVCDHASVARLLLERGVDPDHRDNENETACECARFFGAEGVVAVLEERRAPSYAVRASSPAP